MGALRFMEGAGVPDRAFATVRRYLSKADGEIETVGGPMVMPGILIRYLVPGRDEILIATGPDGRFQVWGERATGLYHDRPNGQRRWKPYRWTG